MKEIAEYATNEDDKKMLKTMATSTEEGKVGDRKNVLNVAIVLINNMK